MSRRSIAVAGLTDGERSWVRLTVRGKSVVLDEPVWKQLQRARIVRFKKDTRNRSRQTTHVHVTGIPMDLTNAAWNEVLTLLGDGLPREWQYLLLPPSDALLQM
jgi:hypothetical protein